MAHIMWASYWVSYKIELLFLKILERNKSPSVTLLLDLMITKMLDPVSGKSIFLLIVKFRSNLSTISISNGITGVHSIKSIFTMALTITDLDDSVDQNKMVNTK